MRGHQYLHESWFEKAALLLLGILQTSNAESSILAEPDTRLDRHSHRVYPASFIQGSIATSVGCFTVTSLGCVARNGGGIACGSATGARLDSGLQRGGTASHALDCGTAWRRRDLDVDVAAKLICELEG